MINAKELLKEKQRELTGGSRLEFPLEKVQVDQAEKAFRIGGQRNEEGEWEGAKYSPEIEIVFLKKYGEYFHYDPEQERITKRTTIEENPQKCVERFSRVPVSELKEAGYDMKYVAHIVGLVKTPEDDEFTCADLQLKGAGLKSFIEFLSSNKEYQRNRLLFKLKVSLEERKKGAVKYVVPVFETVEVSDEEAREILEKADQCVEKFEEFKREYNKRPDTAVEEETEEKEVEHNESIPF